MVGSMDIAMFLPLYIRRGESFSSWQIGRPTRELLRRNASTSRHYRSAPQVCFCACPTCFGWAILCDNETNGEAVEAFVRATDGR